MRFKRAGVVCRSQRQPCWRRQRDDDLCGQWRYQVLPEQHGTLTDGGVFGPVTTQGEGRWRSGPVVAVEVVEHEQAVPILLCCDSGHERQDFAALLVGEGLVVFADDEGLAHIAVQGQCQQIMQFTIYRSTIADTPVVASPGFA